MSQNTNAILNVLNHHLPKKEIFFGKFGGGVGEEKDVKIDPFHIIHHLSIALYIFNSRSSIPDKRRVEAGKRDGRTCSIQY